MTTASRQHKRTPISDITFQPGSEINRAEILDRCLLSRLDFNFFKRLGVSRSFLTSSGSELYNMTNSLLVERAAAAVLFRGSRDCEIASLVESRAEGVQQRQ